MEFWYFTHLLISKYMSKQCLTPNQLLMSSSFIYIANSYPKYKISQYAPTHLKYMFLSAWCHFLLPPLFFGPASCGHKMLKRLRAACSKSDVSVPQELLSKVNLRVTNLKKKNGWMGSQKRLGIIYTVHMLGIPMFSRFSVLIFVGCKSFACHRKTNGLPKPP